MTRVLISIWITILMTKSLDAQTAEDSVKAVVKQLFDGMKNSDAAAIQNTFADSAILQTIAKNKDGKIRIQNEEVIAFANSLV